MSNIGNGTLSINNDVIVQIAGMAALEVEGVAGLYQKPLELKTIKSTITSKKSKPSQNKSIRLTVDSGAIILDVYVCLKDGAKIKTVAEKIQTNIKDKIQTTTGNAVAKVNVIVSDYEEQIAE